jgi:hypothetical protein
MNKIKPRNFFRSEMVALKADELSVEMRILDVSVAEHFRDV